uniref:Proteasome assembly chaperone family protein n=1 Tax=Fervidicoccus fontis TaxID=683846 RepID=A0A7J3ZJV0_9CREN
MQAGSRRECIVRTHGDFSLEGKLVVVGFPGMALVGKNVADALVRKFYLEKKASIFTIHAPGAVPVERGILKPAEISLYTKEDSPVAVLTSPFQPSSEESQNALAHSILSFLEKYNAKRVLAAAAYVSPEPALPRRVYVAASSTHLLERLRGLGAIVMNGGISGLNGLIPGLAPVYSMEGAVLLGETGEFYVASGIVDYRAAAEVVLVIGKLLNVQLEVSDMISSAESVERWIRESLRREGEEERGEREREPHTHM